MRRLFVIALLSLMMTACAKSDETANVTAIAFTQNEYMLDIFYKTNGTVDEERVCELPLAQCVKISPKAARKKTLVWVSSDTEVATVDAEGVVTALKEGETTITASADSVSSSCLIRCIKRIDLESITFLAPAKMESGVAVLRMYKGRSVRLPIKIEPAEVADEYEKAWSSDNKKVATVDELGNVTAVGAGETYINIALTRVGNDGSEEMRAESCKVIVAEPKKFELCYQCGDTFYKAVPDSDGWKISDYNGYLYACADGNDIYHVVREKVGQMYKWDVYKNGEKLCRLSESGSITAFCARHDYVAIAINSKLVIITPDVTEEKRDIVASDGNKMWGGVIATSNNRLSIASDGTIYGLVRVDDGTGSIAAMTRYATDGTVSSYPVPYNTQASSLVLDENDNVSVFVHDKGVLNTYAFDGTALTVTNSMKLSGNVRSLACCCRNGAVYMMFMSGYSGMTGKIYRDYELLYEISTGYKYYETAIDVSADGDIFYCFDRKIFRYAEDNPVQITSIDATPSYFVLNYIN